jgi:uncharacterized protein YdiU (UPF0061 family)
MSVLSLTIDYGPFGFVDAYRAEGFADPELENEPKLRN